MSGASTVGNMIVVWAAGFRQATAPNVPNPTCSDTVNGSYTRGAFSYQDTDNNYVWSAIFYKENVVAGTPTVTVTCGSASDFDVTHLNAREYSGLKLATPADLSQTNTGGSGTAFDTGTATGTTAGIDELLCAMCSIDVGSLTVTWTENVSGSNPSSGWASVLQETSGTTYTQVDGVEKIITTPVTDPIHKWTSNQTTPQWAACVLTLKGRSAALTGTATASITEADIV
jgi:hypothetical protein